MSRLLCQALGTPHSNLLWRPGTQNRQPHTPHHLQAKQALKQWAGLPRRHYLGLTHHRC